VLRQLDLLVRYPPLNRLPGESALFELRLPDQLRTTFGIKESRPLLLQRGDQAGAVDDASRKKNPPKPFKVFGG